ncbi:hypothetical protein WICPIJ_003500 [Wickerhamomyces pijperi]|uniref:HAT C-terminal dimerisation domain-containing protein n=1 Tax=Wickerhamomyces pijperi TaxID=599730 RepID=A0A9P8Q9G9_WICPI|nr:hypothetical protein WICPIJ_003500 [Wickerhamomyces pijperi]
MLRKLVLGAIGEKFRVCAFDVQTRWNSTLQMIQYYLKYQKSFEILSLIFNHYTNSLNSLSEIESLREEIGKKDELAAQQICDIYETQLVPILKNISQEDINYFISISITESDSFLIKIVEQLLVPFSNLTLQVSQKHASLASLPLIIFELEDYLTIVKEFINSGSILDAEDRASIKRYNSSDENIFLRTLTPKEISFLKHFNLCPILDKAIAKTVDFRGAIENSPLVLLSGLLNPAVGYSSFVDHLGQDNADQIDIDTRAYLHLLEEIVINMIKKETKDDAEESNNQNTGWLEPLPAAANQSVGTSLVQEFRHYMSSVKITNGDGTAADNEKKLFKSAFNSNLNAYWKYKGMQFPKLACLNGILSGVPITSVAVERLFSFARKTMHYQRTNLNDTTFENIMLFYCNQDLIDKRILEKYNICQTIV